MAGCLHSGNARICMCVYVRPTFMRKPAVFQNVCQVGSVKLNPLCLVWFKPFYKNYMYLCSHTCTSIGCPDGYEVGFDNRCYSFHQSPVSFAAARSSCLAANDSDLVIIDSPGELEFLLNKTQELNFTDNDSLWIGKCKCCGVLS